MATIKALNNRAMHNTRALKKGRLTQEAEISTASAVVQDISAIVPFVSGLKRRHESRRFIMYYPFTATNSISTKPSLGRRATSTQERAGRASPKKSA